LLSIGEIISSLIIAIETLLESIKFEYESCDGHLYLIIFNDPSIIELLISLVIVPFWFINFNFVFDKLFTKLSIV